MQSAFAFTDREFVWMSTQESLVDGVFVGFAICFPVAFLVLLCATGSFSVAVFAIATIAAVVGSLLGFVAAFLGWELGTGEAIASTIFMYVCQLSFFSKMATLIAGTIAFSLLYSLFFFMPLCAVLGPEGELHTAREQLVLCGRRLQ